MRLNEKYGLSDFAASTGDSMCKVLNVMKFGRADELDSERALEVWEISYTGLRDPSLTCPAF